MTAARRLPHRFPSIHLAVFTYAGVEPDTMTSIVQELFAAAQREIPVQLSHHSEDALISRSRSRALSALTRPEAADVMVMVDRDIAWQIGDVMDIAFAAVEKAAIIGGICSYRQIGGRGGIASRVAEGTEIRIGGLQFHPAEFLGSGFLAIPRAAVEKVLRFAEGDNLDRGAEEEFSARNRYNDVREKEALRISLCAPMQAGDKPWYDFFRPISVPDNKGEHVYLSEDWALCWRAAKAGVPLWLWEKPVIRHWGRVPMTVPMPKKDKPRIVEPGAI